MTTPTRPISCAKETAQNLIFTAEMLNKECDLLLHPLNISGSQFNILSLLLKNPNDIGLPQIVISDILGVHRSNITGMITRMEKNGLVARRSAPGNRKTKYIVLTENGRKVATHATEIYRACLERILSGLSEDEQTELNRLLSRLRRQLNV